jgi:NTP pyrophosphatase (non-canonical NTP hydrolase)
LKIIYRQSLPFFPASRYNAHFSLPKLTAVPTDISVRQLQELIRTMYYDKDAARGAEATFLWFAEEFGELATAIRSGSREELQGEFADVLAWLVTLANIKGIDMTQALGQKYGSGCPGCGKLICQCPDSEKP